MSVLVDAYKLHESLVSKGVDKKTAKAFADAFSDAETYVVTKKDIELVEQRLKLWMTKALLGQTLALITALVAIMALFK